MKTYYIMFLSGILVMLAGCAAPQYRGNNAQTYGTGGALLGGAAGALSSKKHRGRNAAIGALLGGVGGYVAGNETDKANQQRQYQQDRYESRRNRYKKRRANRYAPGTRVLIEREVIQY